jgi:hypothetical protein
MKEILGRILNSKHEIPACGRQAKFETKHSKSKFDEFVKSQKPKKCHAELDSASHKIKNKPDPETSSG